MEENGLLLFLADSAMPWPWPREENPCRAG